MEVGGGVGWEERFECLDLGILVACFYFVHSDLMIANFTSVLSPSSCPGQRLFCRTTRLWLIVSKKESCASDTVKK